MCAEFAVECLLTTRFLQRVGDPLAGWCVANSYLHFTDRELCSPQVGCVLVHISRLRRLAPLPAPVRACSGSHSLILAHARRVLFLGDMGEENAVSLPSVQQEVDQQLVDFVIHGGRLALLACFVATH